MLVEDRWTYKRDEVMESLYQESTEEIIECACGCGSLIDLEDEESYLASLLYEDEWIANSEVCARRYEMKNDLLWESKSR